MAIYHGNGGHQVSEPTCPICHEIKDRCIDNEYCQYRWPALKPEPTGAQPPLSMLHKWVGKRVGGHPADAGSYEYVRYCENCGLEDSGEDEPIPPCDAAEPTGAQGRADKAADPDVTADRQWIEGALFGWKCAGEDARPLLDQAIENRRKLIRAAVSLTPSEPVSPQPQPEVRDLTRILGDIIDRIDMAPNDEPISYIREHVMRHVKRAARRVRELDSNEKFLCNARTSPADSRSCFLPAVCEVRGLYFCDLHRPKKRGELCGHLGSECDCEPVSESPLPVQEPQDGNKGNHRQGWRQGYVACSCGWQASTREEDGNHCPLGISLFHDHLREIIERILDIGTAPDWLPARKIEEIAAVVAAPELPVRPQEETLDALKEACWQQAQRLIAEKRVEELEAQLAELLKPSNPAPRPLSWAEDMRQQDKETQDAPRPHEEQP